MQKYKNAVHNTTTKLAQAVGVWYLSLAISEATNDIEIFVLSFGFLWLATDVALWVYNYVIKPSAVAIYKANR